MSTDGVSGTSGATAGHSAEDVAAQSPLFVHSCSRLGRTANPPNPSFTDWLRIGRRR